jgi:Predicted integral membrane protein
MKCDEIRELLSLYIDRELDESQMKIVADHLAACDSCKNEYTGIMEMVSLLGEIEEAPVPDLFENRWKSVLKNKKKKVNWRIFTSIAAIFAVCVISIALFNNTAGNLPDQMKGTEQSGIASQSKTPTSEGIDATQKKKNPPNQNLADNQVIIDNDDSYSKTVNEKNSVLSASSDSVAQDNKKDDSDSNQEMKVYGSADISSGESGNEDENMAAASEAVTEATRRSFSAMSPKSYSDNTEAVPSQGLERNSAAVQYYTNLMKEKLEGFDYQVIESKYINGEWHFKVFIFHGKDGNTYNEDILIVGKDGAIEVCYANEFMGIQ